MLTAAVVVFGLVAYPRIGVDQLPNIDVPVVTVTTVLPGGDPESMEKNVSNPLEDALSTLNGVDELKSANLESVSQVVVMFKLGVDVDTAAQEVRDRVQGAIRSLPRDAESPVVEKFDLGAAPILTLSLTGSLPIEDLTQLAELTVKPQLQTQIGVGSVTVLGGQKREIQLVVDPERLHGQGLSIGDVQQALASQNLDLPGGRTAQGGKEQIIRLTAEAKTIRDISETIIASPNGVPVRVRDVATVIDGPQEARSSARSDSGVAVALVVRKQSGANTVQVAETVKDSLAEINTALPDGVTTRIVSDNSTFIRSSIASVQFDIVLGAVLAVLIVFVFLRNLRSTLVVSIALPVSIVGTFAVMALLGFTFNIITMLALTLSIGLLIDDAIVVIENIVRHLDEGKTPWQAALEGAKQIAVAVFAVTLAIVAVFVPVAFMEGTIGQFLFQFGITVAVAVLISYGVAMTLTPMLSARVLKQAGHGSYGAISAWLERVFVGIETWYRKALAWVLDHKGIVMAGAVGILVATLGLASFLKFSFFPQMDMSSVKVVVELPQGSTLQETEEELALVAEKVRTMPGVKETFATAGSGTLEEVHKGEVLVNLVPTSKRNYDQEAFKAQVRTELPSRSRVLVRVVDGSSLSGGAEGRQIEYMVRGNDWSSVIAASEMVVAEMAKNPGFTDVDTSYRAGKPQFDVKVDRERAAHLGVVAAQVGATLRAYLGRDAFMAFRENGENYDVKLRLSDSTLASQEAIGRLKIRSTSGALVELRNVADLVPGQGPAQINRVNKQRQITIGADLAAGYSLGEGMSYLTENVQPKIPSNVSADFAGRSKKTGETFVSFGIALGLGILLLYMILAAQFESLIHPFTIMLSLPFSFIGAIGALLLTGQELSIFALIGVIMLMGLVVKNGILLVEFTQQVREEGKSVREAILHAAPVRMRPILMTTIAMIAGMTPMLLAQGDGAEMRLPMALVVVGGLITSTVLTLVVVPVIYSILDKFARKAHPQVAAA